MAEPKNFAEAWDAFFEEFLKALRIPQIVEWLSERLPKSDDSDGGEK